MAMASVMASMAMKAANGEMKAIIRLAAEMAAAKAAAAWQLKEKAYQRRIK